MCGFGAEEVVERPGVIVSSTDLPDFFPGKNRDRHTFVLQNQRCYGNITYLVSCQMENKDETLKVSLFEHDERR